MAVEQEQQQEEQQLEYDENTGPGAPTPISQLEVCRMVFLF